MIISSNEPRLSRGRFSKSAILLLSSLFALGTVACSSDADDNAQGGQGGQVEPGPDAGDDDARNGDAGSDADGDADGDADMDADSDVDSDVDSDADNDADNDADVDPLLARIEVTPAEASVKERRTVQLSAKGFNAGDAELEGIDFTWASSDVKLATVDADGLVTSLRPGAVTITATADGKSAEATMTITESAAVSLEFRDDSADIPLDGKISLAVVVKDAEDFELLDRDVVFTSDDDAIAWVDDDGSILGIDLGETKVKAKLGALEDSIDIRVVRRFTKLFAGGYHTCGLTPAGRAFCWGFGQALGNGDENMEDRDSPVAVAADPGTFFRTLAAGDEFTCGLTHDDKLWCWGNNRHRVLGREKSELERSFLPVSLEDRSYEMLSAMGYGVCGLDASGFAHCWGYSSPDYELGNPGATSPSPLAVAVSAPEGETNPVAFTELSHGQFHSCGLTKAGKLYCWGYGGSGQLGDVEGESRAHAFSPTRDKVVKRFGLGGNFSCALVEDGTTYCWGDNRSQQVNASNSAFVYGARVRFQASAFVPASFALGRDHGCALDQEGRAHCWGHNGDHRLGRDTGGHIGGLGEVDGGHRLVQLVSGIDHTCGLAEDGKTYCWGANENGQLGVGNFGTVTKPTAVVGQ